MILILAMQPGGIIQTRILEAVLEVNAYFDNGKQDTSVGARLAMWNVSIKSIATAPIFGLGNSGWLLVRDEAIADGSLSNFVAGVTHLHNEYLNVTFKRGLLGLVIFLSLYLFPMLKFFKPYLHDARMNVRVFAMGGMVVPMMFMDFGLTQTFLSHNSGRIVLCSFWMCMGALMLNALHDD
jgi:O-antigen ligase